MSCCDKVDQGPRLSVVIPIYNAEKYLDACIRSRLGQNFRNFELLLTDDGSTDSGPEICRAYEALDPRVKTIRKDNGGCFQARLYGAGHARGDHILFCDADDYYSSKTAFQRIIAWIDSYDCDVIQFAYRKKYRHLSVNKRRTDRALTVEGETFRSAEYAALLGAPGPQTHLTVNVWNKVYRRSLLENLPPAENADRLFSGEDIVLNLHLLETCSRALFVPDVLYVYRDLSGGTAKFSPSTMADLDTVRRYQQQFINRGAYDRQRCCRALFHENAGWFYAWVKQGLPALGEERMLLLAEQTLARPSFRAARQYFLEHPEETWTAACLLRSGDAAVVIAQAKRDLESEEQGKKDIGARLKEIYKTL